MKLTQIFGLNKSAIDQIEEHREKLYRVAFSWCHDSMLSEDLVQETLLTGMQKIESLRDRKALTGWLFSILNNQWRQHLRRQKPHVDIDDIDDIDDMIFESDSSPVDECDQHQKSIGIKEAMVKIPIGQRQVITMVDLEDMTYSEVSLALNIPIGTVMSRLSRARKNLLALLNKQNTFQKAPILRRVK